MSEQAWRQLVGRKVRRRVAALGFLVRMLVVLRLLAVVGFV